MSPAFFALIAAVCRCRAADVGDVYVVADREGLPIQVDDVPTGEHTPALLRGLGVGEHEVTVLEGCVGARATVQVEPDRITRAELDLGVVAGVVEVETGVAGARLHAAGLTTSDGRIELPCGPKTIRVSAEGHVDTEISVVVPAWDTVRRVVTMTPEARGTLVVEPQPLDAEVWLDGAHLVDGPTTVDGLLAGAHDLRVRHDAYVEWRDEVVVRAGAIQRVTVTLEKRRPPLTPWTRWVLDGVVTGGALAAGGLCAWQYADSRAAYERYLTVPENEAAERIWAEEVKPAQDRAIVAGVGAAVLGVGSGVLWATSVRW